MSVWMCSLSLLSVLATALSSPPLLRQTASAGSELVLPCSVSESDMAGQQCDWLKDGGIIQQGERITQSNCHLVISPVLTLDQGQFQCQVGGERAARSPVVSLSVNTEPGQPHIKEGDSVMADTGETLHLTCQSGGAKPAAEIEWWNEETGERIVSEVTQHVQKKPNSDSFITTSTIRLTLNSPITIRCSASNDQFPVKKFSEPLQLTLTGLLTSVDVGEGESLRLSCDRGRGEESCDWYINNDQLEGEHQQQLLLTNFIPSFHGVVIGCEVQGRLVKRFKLNLIADRGTTQKAIVTTEPLEEKRARGKMKSLYTCTFAEDEDDNETIPPYIELRGKQQKKQIAEDELKRKFQCRRFSKNKNNFYQIRNIIKSSGSKIRQMYKKLNQML